MYRINEIINKYWLTEAKFMPKMHLRQSGCTYSTCGSFTKNKERTQKVKEIRHS